MFKVAASCKCRGAESIISHIEYIEFALVFDKTLFQGGQLLEFE